ncbi:MAG TPA: hypothetical protein VFM79_12775, partial [Pelobium sp.]|nr:hypothetical protein [Pelobium sp.]
MISKRIKRVLLITYDLNLNQTSSKRYFSFIKALSDSQDFEILALGIRFPFRSHPINPDNKANIPKNIEQYVRTISPIHLNLIQRL